MRVAVTGGAGFIGSHLVDALIARGDDVVVLDDGSAGRLDRVPPAASTVVGDVADPEAVERALGGCEAVLHQAAHRSVPQSVASPLPTDRANTHGTLTVLDTARRLGVRRVVLASSSSVYGGAEELPTPEHAPTAPRSPYAVSKLAGEHYARVFAELHGLETVSLRYFNVFGPRQDPRSAYAAVIPLFLGALEQGSTPTVHGDGQQSRDFTFVTDAVAANLAALAAPAAACRGQAYNIARGERHSLLELLAVLGGLLGTEVAVVHTDSRAGDIRHSQADITRAREDLGYRPSVGFADGLARTVAARRADQPALARPVG